MGYWVGIKKGKIGVPKYLGIGKIPFFAGRVPTARAGSLELCALRRDEGLI